MSEEILSYQEQFATLGITPTADLSQVSRAYRRCASQYHPDVVANLGADAQQIAKRRMIAINNAYDHLKRFLATNPDLSADAPASGPKATPTKPTQSKPAQTKRTPTKPTHRRSTRPTQKKPAEPQVKFYCPHCESSMRVPMSMRGKSGTCSACREQIVVPTHDVVRCNDCGKDNSVPNVMTRKKAICWKCFSELPGRAMP